MIKVKATEAFEKYNKAPKETNRVMKAGEVFEVTEDRFIYLNGKNQFKLKFVEKFEEPIKEPVIEETPVIAPKQTTKKKTTKKTTKKKVDK